VKTIISIGDFVDIYFKLSSSDVGRTLFRFIPSSNKTRVTKSWNTVNGIVPTNWWSIPLIQKRWNKLITGDAEQDYPTYVMQKYLSGRNDLRLLSPGCGTGNKELKFSNFKNLSLIEAFDISPQRIAFAENTAERMGVKNIVYSVSDAHTFKFEKNQYDIILFDSFLHHIKNLDEILIKVYNSLKHDGIFIINEYVGPSRFQWSKEQLKISNETLRDLPSSFKKRWQNNKIKSKIYRPGLLRMIMSDPSEAVNSEIILSKIKERFKILEEKPYGGNILHLTLKDISHNFIEPNEDSIHLINRLFKIEDEYLASGNNSDFVFGVYSK
jgi:ubiquinone/menaquinone biosynthesis C-methylase UbiE